MKGRILWIEGKRSDNPDFVSALRKRGFQVDSVSSGNEALLRLPEFTPDMVVVYAATLRSSGKRICRSVQKYSPRIGILVITDGTQPAFDDECVNTQLTLPFTARKLISRIEPYLPWGTDQVLVAGPIQLDLENRRVRCFDRQGRLTPSLLALLKVLMEHPGEVIRREQLFRQVWQTEYTGDTRTLDVHISWLRHIIEENPRSPVFIKTVRGVGYRLDIE
jgi:DNA-binding response OmpR family regulator